jgi:dye decolorizing peroxidase
VAAAGAHQAGIVLPAVAQPHLLAVVLDVAPSASVGALLAELGDAIIEVTTKPLAGGVQPGDLTVTVGIGPRLVAVIGPELPGAEAMPTFRRERLAETGGDLLIQLCASDALVPALAATQLQVVLGKRATRRWQQRAFRGAPVALGNGRFAPRNGQGFHDGVVVPHSAEELAEGVWIGDGPAAGGTVAVLRRFAFDSVRFAARPVAEQEQAVGRRRDSGVPLSGGARATVVTDPDLQAKTPDGQYLIPVDAHVRRSSALATGVPLMLRRGYPVDDPEPGLLFVSFQNSLRAFTATMERLDESDAMMEFATATASAHFLVLPGFDKGRPLGSTLFA